MGGEAHTELRRNGAGVRRRAGVVQLDAPGGSDFEGSEAAVDQSVSQQSLRERAPADVSVAQEQHRLGLAEPIERGATATPSSGGSRVEPAPVERPDRTESKEL